MARLLGPILASYSIERLAYAVLDQHLGLYLDEVTRQDTAPLAAIDRVERPRSIVIRERILRLLEDQVPAIILVCPGTVGESKRSGGVYRASWSLGVTAVQQSTDEALGRELASIMVAAASALLLHTLPAADERIVSVRWAGEAMDDVPFEDRSRQVCTRALVVDIDRVMDDFAGPPPTLDDPPIGEPPVDAGELAPAEEIALTVTPAEELTTP